MTVLRRIAVSRKMFGASSRAARVQTSHRRRDCRRHTPRVLPERSGADDRVARIRVHIGHRRKIPRHAERLQLTSEHRVHRFDLRGRRRAERQVSGTSRSPRIEHRPGAFLIASRENRQLVRCASADPLQFGQQPNSLIELS
jgi:hypothetical protein